MTKEAIVTSSKSKEQSLPTFIEPVVPVEIDYVPKNLRVMTMELDWNGLKTTVYIPKGSKEVRIVTDKKEEVSEKFPQLEAGFRFLGEKRSLIIRGEIIDTENRFEKGRVDERIKSGIIQATIASGRIHFGFVATDFLHDRNLDLTNKPWLDRKNRLKKLFPEDFQRFFNVSPNEFITDNIERVLDEFEAQYLPAVVFKRRHAPYSSRRENAPLLYRLNRN